MRTQTLRRTAAAGSILAMSLTLAACGGNDTTPASADDDASSSMTPSMSESMTPSDSAEDAGAQTFGAGCASVPTEGAGSFNGMATAPVASAASANPLLKTLVAAVTKAGLVDTLNGADALTVFAPTDDAFAKIPAKDLKGVLADKALLTKILTHHVIAGQIAPEDLAGKHKTLAGDTVVVNGSGEDFTVGPDNAAVICGNVPTANATVYVIDSVLMPS